MERIPLGPINIFIGPNNAGKSSILKALYSMQEGSTRGPDVRIGSTESVITIDLEQINGIAPWHPWHDIGSGSLRVSIYTGGNIRLTLERAEGASTERSQFPAREPNHFVVPYLSKRKTAEYGEDVSEQTAMHVGGNLVSLAAKLSRLGNPGYPSHRQYKETCEAILGFLVTAIPSQNGQRPGVYLSDGRTLPIDQMGEGVPNIVGLLADLAQSRGKLFLIEEPENDLHPEALKALLELIIESSQYNQMVVSTHSNIVARYLGAAADSRLYYVKAQPGTMPPVAEVEAVDSTPSARLSVLGELGYSFSDFDLWDGWLILEESSAERIIRDYLIPWFAPKLTRVRTLSTAGNAAVEPTFDDFNRLVLFTHLEDAYRDSAWVLVDGDESGRAIVERLRDGYGNWTPDRFECFDEEQFERYYPRVFAEQVATALELSGQEKREAKKALLEDVRAWLDENPERGRAALEESARPVIAHLERIEQQLAA
jgi:hypothetical protein